MNHDNENVPIVQVISRQLGFDLPISNVSPTLLTSAEAYFYLGWSVIPLLGDLDPSRPKVPSIPWAAYQHYQASLNEQRQWSAFGGLGIVTGHISHLVVLDFDSETVFTRFKSQCPDLLETHTVRSAGRGLPHLYFHLSDHLHIASQKGQGVDLLSDGRYVVAPPTILNGQPYKITRGGQPKTLTERDIRRIQSFMAAGKVTHSLPAPAVSAVQTVTSPTKPTSSNLIRRYTNHCLRSGRNEALFLTSLYARDTGWSLEEAQQVLSSLHTHQAARGTHTKESVNQRQREARATLQSAYSKPARPIKAHAAPPQGWLSNSVREKLMQMGMTSFIRTYEGLLLAGLKPGQGFTTQEAIRCLKGLVGRDSVRNALNTRIGAKPLFPPVSPRYAVATAKSKKQSNQCDFEGCKNQEIIVRGRPKYRFRLPTNDKLCRLLGVESTHSDVLQREDLATARKTRLALHREMIKRRAGSYSKRWLGTRLGVSRRTIFTYNRLAAIHSRPMYFETTIQWQTIERLPLDEPLQGAYLLTPRGKKYPALRQIASRLLAKGEQVCLKQQTANFYWYGDGEPSPLEWAAFAQQQAKKQELMENFIAQQPEVDHSFLPQTALPVDQPVSRPVSSPNDYRNPLHNTLQEGIATQLYDTLNQFKGDDFQKLSHASARWIAATYDRAILQQELDRIKNRVATGQIRNPVGFFISLVRSTARVNRVHQA